MKDDSVNPPGLSKSDQKRYRDTVTRPKMARAERYIAECQLLGDHADQLMPDVAALFELASKNPSQVVPHIHDLWAEFMFRSAESADGGAPSPLLGNRFLKPLDEFTAAERCFEETLAIMDLRTLATVAEKMISYEGIAAAGMAVPVPCPQNVTGAFARLAVMDCFLKVAAKPIHENWLRARRACHLEIPAASHFENMTDSVLRRLLANARADVLAALLFSAEYDKWPGR